MGKVARVVGVVGIGILASFSATKAWACDNACKMANLCMQKFPGKITTEETANMGGGVTLHCTPSGAYSPEGKPIRKGWFTRDEKPKKAAKPGCGC
ncbi:MAG: hypothetical protein K2Q32_10020 [Alphaproteobacteria bacterium]|nr:hypothetical protein [Alphaproteobacteria bacterium]